MPLRPLAMWASVALILACEQAEPHPELLLRNAGKPVMSAAKDPGTHVLEYVRSYGSLNGPLAFTVIGAVAVHPDGVIAAYDGKTCQIFLIRNESVGTIGACGDGPGELRLIGSLSYQGDTILAWDPNQRMLIRLLMNGEELDRTAVLGYLPEGMGVVSVMGLHDGQVAFALDQPPEFILKTDSLLPLLVVMNLSSGTLTDGRLGAPRVAIENQAVFATGIEACSQPGHDHFHIAVKNLWAFEGMVFDDKLRVVSHFLTPIRTRTLPMPEPMPGYRPESISTVACGDSTVVYWDVTARIEGRQATVTGGHLEVRDYDSRLLLAKDFTAADTALHNRPAAALGDRVFFRANTNMDFPQILEFRLRKRRADDTATVLLP